MEHPYLREYMEKPLQLHKLKLECLQKRMTLMPEGKTDYEKNEIVLDKIKTGGEIKALSQLVAEREAYYLNYFQNQFLPDIEDMEKSYSEVITKARKIAETDQEVKDLLAKVEFVPVGSANVELSLMQFKLLKNKIK